jgi:hypothetical protein
MELLAYVMERLRATIRYRGEEGMTTAELLGNAALGVLALVAIWTVLQALGVDIVNWMRDQLIN